MSSAEVSTEEVASGWWILVAHTLGAAALGTVETGRLGSLGLMMTVVPLFAATGLLTGTVIALVERAVAGRPWRLVALALSAPALVVFVPVSRSLFEGAYAQTLPLAGVAPYVLPLVLWIGAAGAVALGRRVLRAGDLLSRAIVVLALAGVMGAIIWIERNVLKSGYPMAHLGATLALIVLVGTTARITRRGDMPYLIAAIITGLTIGSAIVACLGGLRSPADRQLLATYGDQSRDLVGIWRKVLDFDRDGNSALLGGGDCNDRDAARYPGAVDKPGDGIDQDCDGTDASPVTAQPIEAPKVEDIAAWRATPAVAQILERTKTMNVLVISVDALRADLIAPDAPFRDDFPHITKLLAESAWFTRGFAPATGTDISLSTFLTGRFDPFQPIATTLPEALQAAGRRTYAALPNEVLRYAGEVMPSRGMDKLIRVYTDWDQVNVADHVSAPTTTNEALRSFEDAGERPAFVWVHYFDVHESHQLTAPKKLHEAVRPGNSKRGTNYRALLKGIDNNIGRLFDELAKRNLVDRTIVVFASDHGESFGEDKRLLETHGKVTYAPLVRIPIAIKIPGVAGKQRTEQVSLVDLAPTLLSLLDLKPPMPLDGMDLVPVLLDAPEPLRPPPRAIAIHEELQWSVVEWPYQLIMRPADNIVELYDLEKDPGELSDLSVKEPEVVARLKARYATFPTVHVDRTPNGRSERERLARQRPPRAP